MYPRGDAEHTGQCELPHFSYWRYQSLLIRRHSPGYSHEDRHLQSELIRTHFVPLTMHGLCMNKGFQSTFSHLSNYTSSLVAGKADLLGKVAQF